MDEGELWCKYNSDWKKKISVVKMDVNFVVPGYPARVGHIIYASNLEKELKKLKINVSYSSEAVEGKINHGHINDLISPSTYGKSYIAPFFNPFYKNKYEVITLYGPAAPNLHDVWNHVKRKPHAKVYAQCAYFFTAHHFPKLARASFKKSKVIAISNYLKKKVEYESRVSEVEVINPPLKTIAKSFLEKKNNVVLFTGKGWGVRGDVNVMEAAPYVLKEFPDTKFIIANKGFSDPFYKNRFTRHAKKEKIEKNVKFYGKTDPKKIEKIISEATIGLYPFECAYGPVTIPISLIESMALAKPVISTRLGSIPEIIENNKSGLLVNSGKPKELAASIISLLDDRKLRKRLGEGALKTVKEKYDPKTIAKKYVEIYKNIER